jgi:hypothetical protein
VADRYLLESGAPDGYQLEDGSGVYLLDNTTLEIFDNGGTQVLYLGDGAYSIEKTAATSAYDSGAVSNVGLSGDFVLRIKPLVYTNDHLLGVNSDPLTDNNYASIDFAFNINGLATASIYESGGFISSGNALSTYYWIWRTGTTLGYGTGADIATAQASPLRTVTSSATLYFDSAFFAQGSKAEAFFYVPAASTGYTLTADPATFNYTGQPANLTRSLPVPATGGTFTYSGQPANLLRSVSGIAGSFSYSGQPANTAAAVLLPAAAMILTYSGQPAGLVRSLPMVAASGAFSYAGQGANLLRSVLMGAGPGTFSILGQGATLTPAFAPASYPMAAGGGLFSYTGQDARTTLSLASFPPSGAGNGVRVSAFFYRA